MIKLLLFALLCSLGYRLVRAVGPWRRPPPPSAPVDGRRAVEAEFEELPRTDAGADNDSQ